MPGRDADLAVEWHGIEAIPASARYGSPRRVFRLWFAASLMPATFAIGTLAPSLGLGWPAGVAAILLGNCIGAALAGFASTMGPRTGLAQLPAARLPFGRSILAPALVASAASVAWGAVYAFFGASAIDALSGGGIPLAAGILAVAVAQVLLAAVGYEAIHTFARYAATGLAVAFALVTVALLPHLSPPRSVGFSPGAFVLLTTVVGSVHLGWTLSASDFSRYLPAETSLRKVWLLTFLGLTFSAGWLELLGLGLAGAPGNATDDAVHQLGSLLGGGVPTDLALAAIVIGTVGVNAMGSYSGSLSLLAAGVPIRRPVAAVLGGALTCFVALALHSGNYTATFEDYLLLGAFWTAPWLAIVMVDWRERRGRIGAGVGEAWSRLPSGRNALVALGVGCAAGVPFMDTAIYEGPLASVLGGADLAWVVAFLAAGALYLGLQRWTGSTAVADGPAGPPAPATRRPGPASSVALMARD